MTTVKLTGERLARKIGLLSRFTTVELLPDPEYACETCGTAPTKTHPRTGLCGICGADDFLPMKAWIHGPDFFRQLAEKGKVNKNGVYFTMGGIATIRTDRMYWHAVEGMVYRFDRVEIPANLKHWSTLQKFRQRTSWLIDSWLAYAPGEVNDRVIS